MALLKSSRWLVVFCATILAIAVFLTGSVQSAPAEDTLKTLPAPIMIDLPSTHSGSRNQHSLFRNLESDEKSSISSGSDSFRTLDSIMNMMSNFNLFSNMANLFGAQGTKYEWVPLGSIIFSNRLGQGTN